MFEVTRALVNRWRPLSATLGQNLTSALRGVRNRATRLLVPGVCALCGGGSQWNRFAGGLDLCVHCEAALPRRPARFEPLPACPSVLALCDYRPPADFMVRQLKFAGERPFARVLAQLLADARRELSVPLPTAIVPIPLHADRMRERGFNQAMELAAFLSKELHVPVWRSLSRTRATAAQSLLSAAARPGNVRDCFAAAALPRDCRLALVDDVLTTGSTAGEAVRVLKGAGAADVEVWVVCRAGSGGDGE